MVIHGLGSNPNLSGAVTNMYFCFAMIVKAIVSKQIGSIIDIIKSIKISKGMWSIMKKVLLTVIALCMACRECSVRVSTVLHMSA